MRRRHQWQRRILGTADGNLAGQRNPAVNLQPVHDPALSPSLSLSLSVRIVSVGHPRAAPGRPRRIAWRATVPCGDADWREGPAPDVLPCHSSVLTPFGTPVCTVSPKADGPAMTNARNAICRMPITYTGRIHTLTCGIHWIVIKDILWQDGQGDRVGPDHVPAFNDPAAMFGNKWCAGSSDQPGQKG